MSVLIKNGRVVTASDDFLADVFIQNEKITKVAENISLATTTVIDAANKLVIPGGIDVHTHIDMPYGDIKSTDDFETGTIAAAFGGTTTIIDFAVQSKGQSLFDALNIWKQKADGKAVIDYGFHIIITDANEKYLSELDKVVNEGVTSFKLFTAYPGRLMLNDSDIFRVMQQAKQNGALIMMHAENGYVIDKLIQQTLAEGKTEPIYHALTRPSALEGEATNRTIALAKVADVPVYIVHVTCNEAIDAIKQARMQGQKVFGETCPHYLLLSEDDLRRPNFEGAKYVLSPPLREKKHQQTLWDSLNDNVLQTIATDHCPFNFRQHKELGRYDFTKIPNGAPGIENRLHLSYEFGVNQKRFSLNRWVELVSTNPAKIFGMYPQKGEIAAGCDADIVIWNPNTAHTISAQTHHMRVDYNMFEGFKVTGNAETVIARGEVIVEKNKFLSKPGRGKFIKRNLFIKK
ncbi:MAG: dihydropyrimidinase [Bacteroidota bacterium]|nr:dihydropyrimidinase [Bacteroidota bacterium]